MQQYLSSVSTFQMTGWSHSPHWVSSYWSAGDWNSFLNTKFHAHVFTAIALINLHAYCITFIVQGQISIHTMPSHLLRWVQIHWLHDTNSTWRKALWNVILRYLCIYTTDFTLICQVTKTTILGAKFNGTYASVDLIIDVCSSYQQLYSKAFQYTVWHKFSSECF